MKSVRQVITLAFVLSIAFFTAVTAQAVGPNQTTIEYNAANNPCASASIAKSSVPVAISATGTTVLVPAVTGTKIHVCSFIATTAGTAPSILFLTGTQTSAACDTTPANLSGTFLPGTATTMNYSLTGGLFTGIASGQLCATAGGTTPSFQGILVYAQF